MSLIAFDAGGPEIGRIAKGLALSLARVGARLAAFALRKARPRRLEVALFAGLAAALAFACLLLAADPPAAPKSVAPPPPPVWIDVQKPLPMFDVVAPEFARTSHAYALRRHSTGGGREDILTFGDIAGDGPYLRLAIHQVGEEGARDQTLFVETARRAAEAGLALDGLGVAAALPTRFGTAEWAEARLSVPADGVSRTNCAAFRFAADKPQLRALGLVCGAGDAVLTKSQLSCLVGRLDLTAAAGDVALQEFFARSELARDAACPPARAQAERAPKSGGRAKRRKTAAR